MLQVQNEEKLRARWPSTAILMSFWSIIVKSDQRYDGQEIAWFCLKKAMTSTFRDPSVLLDTAQKFKSPTKKFLTQT